jgi:hypothetical protein
MLVILGLTASHLKAHHRSLAGLGAVVLAASIGLAAALAIIPTNRFLVVAYVDLAFWPISAMAWLFIAGTAARSLVLGASGRHVARRLESSTRIVTIGGVGACVALAGVAAVGMARIEPTGPGTTATAHRAVSIAHAIEARVPRGRVNLNITGPAGSSTILGDSLTIAYVLHVDGWSPGLPTLAANPMGPDYRWFRGAPLVTVVIGPAPEHAEITIARHRTGPHRVPVPPGNRTSTSGSPTGQITGSTAQRFGPNSSNARSASSITAPEILASIMDW